MSSADLAVITSAARRYLAEYRARTARNAEYRGGVRWADLLGDTLSVLLKELDRPVARIDGSQAASYVAPSGEAVLCREDLLIVLGALHDAQDFASTENRIRYAATALRLGDDRL